jgi:hypothetical protein
MKSLVVPMIALGMLVLASCAAPTAVQKDEVSLLDPLMGDWTGHRVLASGEVLPINVQVVAQGNGAYEAVVQEVPGNREAGTPVINVRLQGEHLTFPDNPGVSAVLGRGGITGTSTRPEGVSFHLSKALRVSPTLGARPPAGATILFDGTSLDGWNQVKGVEGKPPVEIPTVGWKLVEGDAMEVVGGTGSVVSKKRFTDFRLHLEFRTPFMPAERGQGRGNSGVYLQGRYEIQVLDSYGLTGEDNECGGIYKVARPRINMCAPPGQWQTYDVTFSAPRFDAAGAKIQDARVTVRHNGVLIHEGLVLPGPTAGGLDMDVQKPGGIFLQDHGNPVQYRNIWIMESGS